MMQRLALDGPEARAALGACCVLLRRWASEAKEKQRAADRGNTLASDPRPAALDTGTPKHADRAV